MSALPPGPTTERAFVFVVCGTREHVETLRFALDALARVSQVPAIVVTDAARNEVPIDWPALVDVATPRGLDHHQASIYLKTALHRFLPVGPTYCYLDSDVIAIDRSCDEVFAHRRGLINFAPDHITLRYFSPYALRCGCIEQDAADRREIQEVLDYHERRARAHSPLEQRWPGPGHPIQRVRDRRRFLKRYSRWRLIEPDLIWVSPEGRQVHTIHCDHLRAQIATTFGIEVPDPGWQHWNGGVFLFDRQSHPFLDAWHERTLRIFTDRRWRTRDQGTLIATAWDFGPDAAPPLPQRFNCIVDPHRPRPLWAPRPPADAPNQVQDPALLHIFHRFGDRTWDVWNWIEASVTSEATDRPVTGSTAPIAWALPMPSPGGDPVDPAVQRGLAFLQARQLPSGQFPVEVTFHYLDGAPVQADGAIFATTHIVDSLSHLPGVTAQAMTTRALDYFRAEMSGPGLWRYWNKEARWGDRRLHPFIPADLDDMANVSFLLRRHGLTFPDNRRSMLHNRDRSGRFHTWLVPRARLTADWRYWRTVLGDLNVLRLTAFWKHTEASYNDVDAVVNANVLMYLGPGPETEPIIDWLIAIVQSGQEATADKWYRDPFTFYYALTRNLHRGVERLRVLTPQIVARIEAAAEPDGRIGQHGLHTALAANALLNLQSSSPVLNPALAYLRATQAESGGWPSHPMYYGGPQCSTSWGSAELTTGFCLEALHRSSPL